MNKISIRKPNLFKVIRDYATIAIGMISYCIGWTIFLLPNNITTGGVTPCCCSSPCACWAGASA